MNANAARLRKVVPLTAALALLLSAAAACLSLGFVSAHELSPQPALAPAQKLAPQPAPERLPHPQLVPPTRPAPEAAPEPAPERAVQPAPQEAISTQQDNSKKVRNLTLTRKTYSQETSAGLTVDWDAPQDTSKFITYQVQYRRSGVSAWTNFTGSIDKTNLAASLEGLISGTTYEAQVRGTGGENGPWSDTVSATTNTAPSATDSTLGDQWNVNLGETKHGGIGGHFTDVDGDTLTYHVWTESPALLSVDTYNDGNGPRVRATVLNPGGSTFYYWARDAYGGQSATKSHQVNGTANVTRTVAEHSPAGTAVGNPVAGTPYNGETLTHTLTGEAADSGVFAFDAATGQISVADCGALDYETKSSYAGEVSWTFNNLAAVANVTINVTDLDPERLCPTEAPAVARTEFSEQSDPALDVAWTVPASNGLTISWYELRYRKQGETVWTNFSEYTLEKRHTSATLSGLEAGATYQVQVRTCTNEVGCGPWSETGEGRANRLPHYVAHYGNVYIYYVNNNQPVGVTWVSGNIGTFFADSDKDPLTWDVTSQYPGIGDVGEFQTINGNVAWTFTFYNPGTLDLTYGVNDGYGGYIDRTFSWTGKQAETRNIAENSPAGTLVGDPVTGTPYDDGDDSTDDSLEYTLTGDAATAFVIDSATGQISVKQGATLDYETTSSYTGQVNWTIQDQPAAADLTINVTDVEAGKPGTPTVTRTEFDVETAPALDVTWTAADANGLTITGYNVQWRKEGATGWTDYTVDDGNGGHTAELPATTTTINLPDLEAGATYEAQVRALTDATTNGEDVGPWSDTGEGTANTPPKTISPYPIATPRVMGITHAYSDDFLYDGSGDLHGKYFDDPDGDTLTYSSSAEHPGIYTIYMRSVHSPNPSIRTVFPLNPATSTVTDVASDGYGGFASGVVTFKTLQAETRYVAENSPAGTAVGDPVTGTPYDDGDDETDDALTYSLAWDDGHTDAEELFVIDSATGQISVKEGASLDFETTSSYTGQVNWTVQGQQAVARLTINVTDVEATIPSAPTVTRTEFDVETAPALDVTWTAAADNGFTITGYEAQYRVKVAEGETENAWTAYSGTLAATDRTLNLDGLTPGETYEAQVRAVTSEEGAGPWSGTGEGTANTPPAASNAPFRDITFGMGGSLSLHEEIPLGEGPLFTDAEGDALVYSAHAEHPALVKVTLTGVPGNAELRVDLLNPGASKVHYTARDPYGGQVTRTATYTVEADIERSIAENSPAGTLVRNPEAGKPDPVTGTPYDDGNEDTDDSLTYTLTDGASGDVTSAFVIDSATGQITVATDATLDFETKSSYTGQVSYTVDGHACTIDLTINVTDVEATIPNAPTVTRTEFDVETAPALDVTWTADANGLTITGYNVQWRKKDTTGWTDYTVDDGNGGQTAELPATTTTVNLPDLDASTPSKAQVYEAQVRAVTTEEAEGPWSVTGEGTANTPPNRTSIISLDQTMQWGCRAKGATPISGHFADEDGDTLTYSAESPYPGLIRVRMAGAHLSIHCMNPTSRLVIRMQAQDQYGGLSDSSDYGVTVVANPVRSVPENSAAGTEVGRAVQGVAYDDGDEETDDSLTHTLTWDTGHEDAAGLFVIDAATGQISVAEGAGLNYETKSSYTGKVEWTVQGQQAVANLTINVTDVGAGKPGTPTVTRTEFTEPSAPALDVTWTAAAANGFTITGYEAQYRVKAAEGETENAWTDYTGTLAAADTTFNLPGLTPGATYEVQVRAVTDETTNGEDAGPWSDTGEGRANTPPAPTTNNLPTAFHEGNPPFHGMKWGGITQPWSLVTPAQFTDDDQDTLTFTAEAEYPGLLRPGIENTKAGEPGLRIRQWNPAVDNAKVTYYAHDGYGGSASKEVWVRVVTEEVRVVRENSPAGTNVGRHLGGNPWPYDGDNNFSYTMTGKAADSGKFALNTATGQITVAQGASLDYETENSYPGQVKFTVQGQSAAINFTIKVTDQSVGKPGTPTVARAEFSEPTDPALDVTWTAADANGLTITGYNIQHRKKGATTEWSAYTVDDGNGGQTAELPATTSTINLTDLDAGATYEVQVRAVTSEEGVGPWSGTGEGMANNPPDVEDIVGELYETLPFGRDYDRDVTDFKRSRRRPADLLGKLLVSLGSQESQDHRERGGPGALLADGLQSRFLGAYLHGPRPLRGRRFRAGGGPRQN